MLFITINGFFTVPSAVRSLSEITTENNSFVLNDREYPFIVMTVFNWNNEYYSTTEHAQDFEIACELVARQKDAEHWVSIEIVKNGRLNAVVWLE
jgi:hypothetical protein